MRSMETQPSTVPETRPARRCSAIWDNLSDLPLIMQVMLAMLASVISIVLGYLVFNFAINEITKSVSINEITKSIDASSSAGAPPSHIWHEVDIIDDKPFWVPFWNRRNRTRAWVTSLNNDCGGQQMEMDRNYITIAVSEDGKTILPSQISCALPRQGTVWPSKPWNLELS